MIYSAPTSLLSFWSRSKPKLAPTLRPNVAQHFQAISIKTKFKTNSSTETEDRAPRVKLRHVQLRANNCFSSVHLPSSLAFLLLLFISLLLVSSNQCLCLNQQNENHAVPVTPAALLSPMEPIAPSIFSSLLGTSNTGFANTAAQHAQQSAADLHQSYKNGQTSDKVTLPGDILLGGLFPIHMKGTKVECGEINRDRGIQRLEAMLYALDRINEDAKLLPDIKLGAILLDSCSSSTYALNQSLEFIRASINTVESSAFECKDKSTPRPKYGSKMIAGVIGGSYSEVSLQVANLLRLFRIPQVSYASTGTALSDKTLYDLFARTVPSDMFQARAIADIVLKLNWSYVSLVSSEGLYGDSGSKEFMKQASVRRICIATHEKISPTSDESAYDALVENLRKRNATGVVLFTRAEDTRELLLAVKRASFSHNFVWVAADGWGTHQKLVEGVEEVAWGAITVELAAKAIPGFDQYMRALTPWANARNPWFSEYWQEWFDCQLQTNLLLQQQVASGLFSRREIGAAQPSDDDYADSIEESFTIMKHKGSTLENNGTQAKRRREAAQLISSSNGGAGGANLKQFCSPNLRISESNGYRQEQKVQFVVDAVYAMAHALHKAWYNLCDGQPGVVCEALKELNGGDFYAKYLLNVSFEDLAGSEVKFDERGDGLGRYNIYNFRQVRKTPPSDQLRLQQSSAPATNESAEDLPGARWAVGVAADLQIPPEESTDKQQQQQVEHIYTSNVEFEYSSIGRWTENDYYLKLDDIEFVRGERQIPESYCSRPCELGQAKIMRAGDHCCWICKTCAPYEYLPDEFNCQDCGIGRWPVQNKTSCFDLPQKYLRWDSVYSLISLSIACLGIALTAFVSIIFIKYLDTPVVKASGRELSFILLAGIAFCHLSTFVLLSKPTFFICGTQRFLVNFGFALMYASLLVKTNRISRIFNCARKSAKRPSFISPKSQMLITGILVAIQIFLTIVWFVFEPPGIRADSPEGKRDEVILKCRVKGKSFIISLVYNMILITTCTIYAVKTRKIPENFNESKFIGFTMYTTIVIWLAFVTMFFGTNNSHEIQINTMCVCISLSAYVTLFCLFSPKLSIILLHPDKNVRKLTMNSATYKRPFKPVSSFASVDGRNNLTGGTFNGAQTDGGSGGPMSTTSNVINLAESQTARFQESSVGSNVVNSNSSNSQKTPTTLSQQLTLVGTCANCGAQQLSQAPNAFAPIATDLLAKDSSKRISSGQKVNKQSEGKEQTVVCTKTMTSTLNRSSVVISSSQNVVTSSNGAASNNNNSSKGVLSNGKAAKVLHTRIAHVKSNNNATVKRIFSDDHLLHETRLNDSHHRLKATEERKDDNNICMKTKQISLNEMTSISSNHKRHCDDESASSLINDSILNTTTSQENTPCNFPVGARQGINYSTHQLQQQQQHPAHNFNGAVEANQENVLNESNSQCLAGKGSDSMLWNQSVYSIDYCSDCCPSLCHCSCPACSSSNGGEDPPQLEASGALCMHSANNHQVADTEEFLDDYDAMCDSLLIQEDDDCNIRGDFEQQASSSVSACTTVALRRRKSEEPGGRSAGGLEGGVGSSYSERTYFLVNRSQDFARQGSPDVARQQRYKVADSDSTLQREPAKTRRSQTMEMRTLATGDTTNQRIKANQEANGANAGANRRCEPPSAPVVYAALQAAANSVLGPCTISSQIEGGGGDERHQQGAHCIVKLTSNKDKFSEKTRNQINKSHSSDSNEPRRDATRQKAKVERHLVGTVTQPVSQQQLQQQEAQVGTIQASLDLVMSDVKRRQRGDEARRRHRGSSCFDYHDDYEYNYGLVQENSDSEYNYDEDDDEDDDVDSPDPESSSMARDDTTESTNQDDCYDDDFEHDGRMINRPRHARSSTVKAHPNASGSSSKRNKDLQLEDHRIKSVALIAATLSAGGAIVESGSSTSRTQSNDGTQSSSNQQQERRDF